MHYTATKYGSLIHLISSFSFKSSPQVWNTFHAMSQDALQMKAFAY